MPSHNGKRYPAEVKERAVRMVLEAQSEDPRDRGVFGRIARQLGVGAESLRSWVKQAEVDSGRRAGVTTSEAAEIKRLQKDNRELRRANEILKSAAAFFGAELDRRPQK